MDNVTVKAIEERIAELKRRWPRHSVSPIMLQELDELKDALLEAKKAVKKDREDA